MERCCSPSLGDPDPNAYRRQIDRPLAIFDAPGAAPELILAELDPRTANASAARHYESAAALLRRRERLAGLLDRLGGVLRAVHADPRLVVARHPAKMRHDAFWIVAGRVADWGALPTAREVQRRADAALAGASPGGRVAHVPAEEVDEVRIVAGWVAEHEPPQLRLEHARDRPRLTAWLSGLTAGEGDGVAA